MRGSEDIGDQPDGRLYVSFDLFPEENKERSAAEGRPIFEDKEYVSIIVPGDRQNKVHRPVRPTDMVQFKKAYEEFKSGRQAVAAGTPLSEWSAISKSQVEELRHFHVRTVEQLAGLSDGSATNIGPIQALRTKAKDFMAQAAGSAPLLKMRSELEQRDNELETLRRQQKEQAAQIEQLMKAQGERKEKR